MEDEVAVDRVLAGDVSAFTFIVQRWQGPIVNLAYRFCHDRIRAEDMAQDAFLRVFRTLRSWRRESSFSTWLFAIATNVYRSELRRLLASSVYSAERIEGIRVGAPEELASVEQRLQTVRVAVQSLPPKYREAIIVFYFHEMDIAQASRSLGIPEGTLKTRLSRARELLRRKLTSPQKSADSGAWNAKQRA